MGRLLGAHESDELDRPDLNKCPDCGCYFAGDNCPICGKECPEEMRAGNRKAVKPKKHKNSSGRVTFVEWYHRWWFIAIMMFFIPVAGIILLITSPHKKWQKVLAILIIVAYMASGALSIAFGGGGVNKIMGLFTEPVDRLSLEEYSEKCVEITPEEFFRNTSKYDGKLISMTLTVKEGFVDSIGHYSGGEYNSYYICTDAQGGEFEIMIRDCEKEPENYIKGDVITIYGEGAGKLTLDDLNYVTRSAPCIYAAHIINS